MISIILLVNFVFTFRGDTLLNDQLRSVYIITFSFLFSVFFSVFYINKIDLKLRILTEFVYLSGPIATFIILFCFFDKYIPFQEFHLPNARYYQLDTRNLPSGFEITKVESPNDIRIHQVKDNGKTVGLYVIFGDTYQKSQGSVAYIFDHIGKIAEFVPQKSFQSGKINIQ